MAGVPCLHLRVRPGGPRGTLPLLTPPASAALTAAKEPQSSLKLWIAIVMAGAGLSSAGTCFGFSPYEAHRRLTDIRNQESLLWPVMGQRRCGSFFSSDWFSSARSSVGGVVGSPTSYMRSTTLESATGGTSGARPARTLPLALEVGNGHALPTSMPADRNRPC